jgi:pimeloyl-ACP methyl ester carboxylesterase
VSLLAHRLDGDGDGGATILFLNGGLMTYAAWQPFVDAFQDEYRLLRCDLRGQLLSPGKGPVDVGGHVEDVVALLDALGLAAVHVVATSFGAFVGLLLAARRPGRVLSLAAITTTARVDERGAAGARELRRVALEAASGGDGGRFFDFVRDATYSPAYVASHAEMLAERRRAVASLPASYFLGAASLVALLESLDLTGELPRIGCPTLVVEAALDATFPAPQSEELARLIPGARRETMAGCGHALIVEKPEELIDRLRVFLRSVGAAAA